MNSAARITSLAIVAMVAVGATVIARPVHAEMIPLQNEDQRFLDEYLGQGVVGAAIDAERLSEPTRFYPLRSASLFYRLTSGKREGKSEEYVWKELDRNPPGSSWSVEWGDGSALFLHRTENSTIHIVSRVDGDEGVKFQYSPPQPLVLAGMRPGDERKSTSDVSIFGLSSENDLIHSGSLDMTVEYIGAYQVKTPGGSYNAILLKSVYAGMIGSKKVSDVSYRLLAPGVGTVAEVEGKALSALLDPRDETRTARVLLAAPQGASESSRDPEPVAVEPINSRDRDARAVAAKFKEKDPGLARFFHESAGWAVFPTIAKGGLIVGGARGDGAVYKNDQLIGYSTVTQGTIGLQIGGQAYSEVVFFEHEAALDHFKSGNAEFSGQVSAVAVTAGASADAGYAEGVAVFTIAKGGAMLEASIGGQGFSYKDR